MRRVLITIENDEPGGMLIEKFSVLLSNPAHNAIQIIPITVGEEIADAPVIEIPELSEEDK